MNDFYIDKFYTNNNYYKSKTLYELYTDGSVRGNGKEHNEGGWGVFVMRNKVPYKVLYDTVRDTTNNRMELTALLEALHLVFEDYQERDCDCIIWTDSMYCVNIWNEWMRTWAQNNWKNSSKKTVENLDLILQLYEYYNIPFSNVDIMYVKGHKDNFGNEIADCLATGADMNRMRELFLQYLSEQKKNSNDENMFII